MAMSRRHSPEEEEEEEETPTTTTSPADDPSFQPLSREQHLRERIHKGWTAKCIGTARCDRCDRQSRGVVQKCQECGLSVCFECSEAGALAANKNHLLDHDAVCWDRDKAQKRRSRKMPPVSRVRQRQTPARDEEFLPLRHKATQTPGAWSGGQTVDVSFADEDAANILLRMPSLARTYDAGSAALDEVWAHGRFQQTPQYRTRPKAVSQKPSLHHQTRGVCGTGDSTPRQYHGQPAQHHTLDAWQPGTYAACQQGFIGQPAKRPPSAMGIDSGHVKRQRRTTRYTDDLYGTWTGWQTNMFNSGVEEPNKMHSLDMGKTPTNPYSSGLGEETSNTYSSDNIEKAAAAAAALHQYGAGVGHEMSNTYSFDGEAATMNRCSTGAGEEINGTYTTAWPGGEQQTNRNAFSAQDPSTIHYGPWARRDTTDGPCAQMTNQADDSALAAESYRPAHPTWSAGTCFEQVMRESLQDDGSLQQHRLSDTCQAESGRGLVGNE